MADAEKIAEEINFSESSVLQIKSEVDVFEQLLKRVESGHGSIAFLNENYHKLILSTKDLSGHLNALRRNIDLAGRHVDLRARARNLHSQTLAQLRRVQSLGAQVQHISSANQRSRDNDTPLTLMQESSPSHHATSLVDVFPKETQLQQEQKQMPAQLDLDEQRARDMERLEADIVQVNELFTTMATYVHDQGDLVDSIGDNIEVAYEQVHSGTQQLNTASKHRKSARRKKCFCLIVGLVILAILGLALGLALKN